MLSVSFAKLANGRILESLHESILRVRVKSELCARSTCEQLSDHEIIRVLGD